MAYGNVTVFFNKVWLHAAAWQGDLEMTNPIINPHPAAKIYPSYSSARFLERFKDYSESCEAALSFVVLLAKYNSEWRIADGREHYRICQELGIQCEFETFEGSWAELEVELAKRNKDRRHLTLKELTPPVKTITVQKDDWDIPIQDHAKEAFGSLPEFAELLALLKTAGQRFHALCNKPGGYFLVSNPKVAKWKESPPLSNGVPTSRWISSNLEKLRKAVEQSMPSLTVCPSDHASLDEATDCKTCQGKNWTAKMKTVPNVFREAIQKKYGVGS
jgi:hypothetical protein